MINTQDFDICVSGDVIGVIRWRQICISLGTTVSVEKKPMYDERTSLVNYTTRVFLFSLVIAPKDMSECPV